ncbi:PREDICTED: olfactory receptor 5D18-like [Galeopterus variegatus]|uniref:Olfactory receptor 5D18-like n=1 Tax=Galeopterus variegatus TaxID=482537 RepID=A0ABM0Q343_GALVR|nr:PREDICTED: olfactory receptor 5D18-like [Galeopterus variegatus]
MMMLNEVNESAGATFVLLHFSEFPHLQAPLFLVFLAIYNVTVMGNLGRIGVIKINPKLHTPMYLFLGHLSLDFCYSTVVTPKILEILVVKERIISFRGCIIQFLFTIIFVITEANILAAMAYDWLVAVYKPLLYTVAIFHKIWAVLLAGTHIWGGLGSMTLIYSLLEVYYCGSTINHFCCEFSALLSVSCSDTNFSQMLMLVVSTRNEACSLLVILTSYVFIVVTIIKLSSTGGHQKAFSTCASHLTTITIFLGTLFVLYSVPKSKSSWLLIKVATVFYSIAIPMLNPLIYSIRNKEGVHQEVPSQQTAFCLSVFTCAHIHIHTDTHISLISF